MCFRKPKNNIISNFGHFLPQQEKFEFQITKKIIITKMCFGKRNRFPKKKRKGNLIAIREIQTQKKKLRFVKGNNNDGQKTV